MTGFEPIPASLEPARLPLSYTLLFALSLNRTSATRLQRDALPGYAMEAFPEASMRDTRIERVFPLWKSGILPTDPSRIYDPAEI